MSSAKPYRRPLGRRAQTKSVRALALSIAVYATLVVPVVGNLAASSAVAAPAIVPSASFVANAKGGYTAEMSITPAGIAQDGSSLVSVRMPTAAQADTLHVYLNGSDVTAKFNAASCPGAQCLSAKLDASDGLRFGKNVFQAEGKADDGKRISARSRFDGRPVNSADPQAVQAKGDVAAMQAMTVAEPFMAPTVGFRTLNGGGYHFGGSPWLSVGGASYPASGPAGCSSGNERWTVIVLARQTLEHKTSAPESSPRCFESNQAMTSYLQSLPSGDLVVAGTNYGFSVDGSTTLDTTAIGGTNFGAVSNNPAGYMIIGASGATGGSAFEPHYSSGHTAWNVTVQGILQEDANGDYNFLSGDGDFVRFVVVPNSPAHDFNDNDTPMTSVQISLTGLQKQNNPNTNYISYSPPAGSTDGFWLLRLNRGTLERLDDCTNYITNPSSVYIFQGCGKFYATNTSTHDTGSAIAAMKQLAADINSAYGDPWQLLILTTVGHATCCDWTSALGIGYGDDGYAELHPALEQFGGTPALTTYGNGQSNTTPGLMPAYTLVTSTGLGNPLSGPVVESSTALLATHGQTGTVSGTLERDNDAGLFTPGQINQEFTSVLISKGGLDNLSVINRVAVQAPVEWPAESQAQKLSGADSIQGQIDAYRFVSLSLLRDKYAVGIAGSHQDDLHYFFTGSLNTSIDYHIFDPINLPWPGSNVAGFTQCSSVTPGTNGNDTCSYNFAINDTLTFTANDFNAVRSQTSQEVRHLTNVLQFFVTGSTNMRDSIIGGNANVGLALTSAAATILGNQLMPMPPEQKTTTSWQSILGMVNGILTVAAGIPGLGELTLAEDAIKAAPMLMNAVKQAGAWSNELAGVAGIASGAGSIKSTTTATPLPSKYSKFALTVGQVASGALQDQLAHGFDAMVDSVTSDWGRISTIGPRIVDVDDPAFFVPNQAVREIVLDGITSGAERSFYSALLPSFFEVHYWPSVSSGSNGKRNGVQQPDMGYYYTSDSEHLCWSFYVDPHEYLDLQQLGTISPFVSVYTPRPAGMTKYFPLIGTVGTDPSSKDYSDTDYYVIAKPSDSKGSENEIIPPMDTSLGTLLFSSQGLNIPMLQFVHPNGPMSSVFLNAGTGTDITTHHNSQICDGWYYLEQPTSVRTVTDPDLGVVSTSTSLAAPGSGLLGSNLTLTATVAAGSAVVPEGMMYFRVDGKVAASVPMQPDGTASYQTSTLNLGTHSIKASYGTAARGVYAASSSDVQTLTIYSDGPDFKVTSSSNALTAKRGTTSAPTTISVASLRGTQGNVSLACSGLPMGAVCNFAPSQLSIADGGTATTSMTVSTTTGAGMGLLGLLFLPMFAVGADRRRKVLAMAVLMGTVSVGALTGCSGDKHYAVQTGTVQVLVSATIGDMTRTVPISVTISE